MIQQTQGKIFLSEERGHNEIEWFRSYATFSFGAYQHPHKMPFGPLYVLNDETLAGGHHITCRVEEDSYILLLPLVGAISYAGHPGHTTLIEAGECMLLAANKGFNISIGNPYENELVNFLQVWVKRGSRMPHHPLPPADFDIHTNKNELVTLGHIDDNIKCYIGKYEGRHEDVYTTQQPGNGFFVFVIEGAFEVQNRLLHARDGLALWGTSEIEWEALSNDAILVVMELPL